MLVTEAPGKDLQRSWNFFSAFLSVWWGELNYRLEAAKPASSPLFLSSMQASATTAAACLQLGAEPSTGGK